MMSKTKWTKENVPPLYEGLGGKVWEFAAPSPDTDDPRMACAIGRAYLIFAPQAHPFWSWHALLGVALRDVPGVPPAHRKYPEAEYELMVWAIDPERTPPDPREYIFGDAQRKPGMFLQPPDVIVQFHGTGDDGAAEVLRLCARAVADGVLVPDSD